MGYVRGRVASATSCSPGAQQRHLVLQEVAKWSMFGKDILERAGLMRSAGGAALLTNIGVSKGRSGDHDGALEAFQSAKAVHEGLKTLDTPPGQKVLRMMEVLLDAEPFTQCSTVVLHKRDHDPAPPLASAGRQKEQRTEC